MRFNSLEFQSVMQLVPISLESYESWGIYVDALALDAVGEQLFLRSRQLDSDVTFEHALRYLHAFVKLRGVELVGHQLVLADAVESGRVDAGRALARYWEVSGSVPTRTEPGGRWDSHLATMWTLLYGMKHRSLKTLPFAHVLELALTLITNESKIPLGAKSVQDLQRDLAANFSFGGSESGVSHLQSVIRKEPQGWIPTYFCVETENFSALSTTSMLAFNLISCHQANVSLSGMTTSGTRGIRAAIRFDPKLIGGKPLSSDDLSTIAHSLKTEKSKVVRRLLT